MSELAYIEGGEQKGTDGRCHACGCVGPNPGTSPLADEEILEEMKSLRPLWTLSEDKKNISRKFTCRNWQAAMNAMQEISMHAESKDIQHHPDLHLTNYRDLEIVLWTHAAGGLTKYDFILARAIDKVKVDYSPKWLKQNPLVLASEL